jgi:hypothetical protein
MGWPRRAAARIRLERKGCVGASASRPASRPPPSCQRKHHLPRLGGRPAGDRKTRPWRTSGNPSSRRLHVRRFHPRGDSWRQSCLGMARLLRHGGREISAQPEPTPR